MIEIFGPIEQCCSIADDLIVFGFSEKDHNRVIFVVLDMAKCVGLCFIPHKCIFCCTQIPFFGMIVRDEGIKPYHKKIKALQELPMLNNVHEMQSFLEIVNYLSRFRPEIANLTCAFRQVIKKGIVFKLEHHHEIAFKVVVKEFIRDDHVLKYYDPFCNLYLECDASGISAGLTLLQNFTVEVKYAMDMFLTPDYLSQLLPIAHKSRTFTRCKRQYANIKCELLAIICGVKKCNYYTFRRHTYILSDHKPLSSTILKDLINALPRLQRMQLCLQKYNITIRHRKGSEIVFADHLSYNWILRATRLKG